MFYFRPMQSTAQQQGFAKTYESERVGPKWLRQTVIPALLISVCPPTAILIWYVHSMLGGSLSALYDLVLRDGALTTIGNIWGPVFFGTKAAWGIIGTFALVELILMRLLPGKEFLGPITANGNVPVYKANGVAAFLVSLALFCGASF